MERDEQNVYRPQLEQDPPKFVDRVDTPWSDVPDLTEYNGIAYRRILRALNEIQRPTTDDRVSRGVLILGEAGTGKTHLLMRVANKLSDTNHILFVRKPNNEDAVAQHVWFNIVNSLTRRVPSSGVRRSQLDDLLAHVFSQVLIPEFEEDIRDGKDVDQRRRWVELLRATPFNLFSMLGEGERRTSNLRAIRRRTLRYLQVHYPDVDQRIAHVLITYCFVSRDDHKRMLLTWLSGQDIDESDATALGLTTSWMAGDEETVTDTSWQQQREEQALRAIRTIGILSTNYQPLILAFDQLEGLRNEERLTRRWGDVVREIFTMTPNLLVVTCIFPTLWEEWFSRTLDESVAQRIAQSKVTLEEFGPQHGMRMLETHLRESFETYRLPHNLYPFTEDDVRHLCANSKSARSFIQNARSAFESWLDEFQSVDDLTSRLEEQVVVTQRSIDEYLQRRLEDFEKQQQIAYLDDIPIEGDFFGRLRNILRTLLDNGAASCHFDRAQLGTRVMPPNILLRPENDGTTVCFAVMYRAGNAFAARLKNLRTLLAQGKFDRLIILRDLRCTPLGPACRRYVDEVQAEGIPYIHGDAEELAVLNAIYEMLVAIEEHDVSLGSVEVSKNQFVEFLKAHGVLRKAQTFRKAATLADYLRQCVSDRRSSQPEPVTGPPPVATRDETPNTASGGYLSRDEWESARDKFRDVLQDDPRLWPPGRPTDRPRSSGPAPESSPAPALQTPPPSSSEGPDSPVSPPIPAGPRKPARAGEMSGNRDGSTLDADVVVGDLTVDCPHQGILGTLQADSRKLAISLAKPQCLGILGYMGSGKSYALGVLIENSLLNVPKLISHTRPLSVVAFNYRRNPESRFEYGGFARENAVQEQVVRLQQEYAAASQAIGTVNVFAFEPELERRRTEYAGMNAFPIQFLSRELGAEHWEILMKPPTPQAEYMDIIRDIIQKLFYADRLTYRTLEHEVLNDERLSESQRRRAQNRLSFAQRWICDQREYDWSQVLREGALNVVDLRMQTLESSEALKLCLIITDLVRRTRNGVNKVIVFDEAHEYVDSRHLVDELENAITQIRHDGLSFVLASQFPDRIPERIFKYLLTRLIFKLPHAQGVNYLRRMAANLDSLSAIQLGNLDLEQGLCLVQTDDDCSDTLLRRPQLLRVRPRCTQHGGATIRQSAGAVGTAPESPTRCSDSGKFHEGALVGQDGLSGSSRAPGPSEDAEDDESKTLADLNDEFGISWRRFLKLLGLPDDSGLTPDMTLGEARRITRQQR